MHAPFLGAPCGLLKNMLSDLGACVLFVCAAFLVYAYICMHIYIYIYKYADLSAWAAFEREVCVLFAKVCVLFEEAGWKLF